MTNAQTPKRRDAHPQNALIVFAKPPEPGQVKTRLTSVLSEAEAARLYEAFLRDALQQYRTVEGAVRLYWAPSGSEGPPDLTPAWVEVEEQAGPDLGTRMLHAFRETLSSGFDRAVIIGTDHPTLPSAFIEQAFEALEDPPSICIGPSDDGGYYLLGMTELYPQLFAEMSYSHAEVFADTLRRAEQTDAQLTILPAWYDVDTPAGLQRLIEDLEASDGAGSRTRQIIDELNLEDRIAPE